MQLPKFFTVKNGFASRRIDDVGHEVTERLRAESVVTQIQDEDVVAIAVGSRGIDRIDEIVRAVVAFVVDREARPFIVPAMGSHGGATDAGQAETLASLGITEESVGCPIMSCMDTVQIGQSDTGMPLHFDAMAAAADHLIVINRVKQHTRLCGSIQSGLCKMLMIGLGKRNGAIAFHPAFRSMEYRLDRITDDVIPTILDKTPFLMGIAIVEDSHDSVGQITMVPADQLLVREAEILKTSIEWMPKLPFDTADLLIIDEIGKEISGTGLDTNVVGRKWNDKIAGQDEWPKIHEIFVRSLTEKTAGNASGIGIAEYTHRRVAENIDADKTRINCITAGHPTGAALPIWFDTDREVLSAVCDQSPMPENQRRWIWIRNTLDLVQVHCSEGFLDEARKRDDLTIVREPTPMQFCPAGDLVGPLHDPDN